MDPMLTTAQTLATVRALEPRHALTYRQVRDLEFRGCVVPRVMPGGKGPRVFDAGEIMLLRLIARLHADDMLSRWQAWAVVANLHDELRDVLLDGTSRVLMIQGARGAIVTGREAAALTGVPVPLADVSSGVREAIRRSRGLVWNGWAWVPQAEAAVQARELGGAVRSARRPTC
jgi:hypothetical protein